MPLLSVIIPAYNAARTIDACLESVLASVGREGEIICVNDGSTDGTGEKLQQWASKDSRIRVIRQDNGGVSRARNAALGQVTGRYVTFVDADDTVREDFLPALWSAAEATGADCVVAGWEEQGRVHQLTDTLTTHEATAEGVAALHGHVWSHAYSARALQRSQARFYPGLNWGEDTLFHYCLYPWCNKIALAPDTGYLYSHDSPHSLMTQTRQHVWSLLDGADALAAYYDRHDMLPRCKGLLLRFCIHAMNCVRAQAPLSRQKEAAGRMRSLFRSIGIGEGDTLPLRGKEKRLVRSLIHGGNALGYDFYKMRFLRLLHGR